METTKISFRAHSFRKIPSPYEIEGIHTYIAVVNVRDIPLQFDNWRTINVRDPKLTSGVAVKIKNSLVDEPSKFLFKNRGLTMVAHDVAYDNKTDMVSVEMFDKHLHGLLDGGHTFRVITSHVSELTDEERQSVDAFVKIEFIQGMSELEDVVNVVEARNTSNQVKPQSIEELKGSYEQIKEVLKNMLYADRIAYKEHELDIEGEKKDIDVREILSYLVCFDAETYTGDKHPIIAYSSKGAVLEHFKNNPDSMGKYIKLLPKILELRDHIYAVMPEAYNSTGGKFGRLTDVGENAKPKELTYSDKKTKYKIPSAFIYPALAAFRSLLNVDGDKVNWKDDPVRFFETIKVPLSQRVVEQAIHFKNPTKMGKDKATWRGCSDLVKLEVFERGLN